MAMKVKNFDSAVDATCVSPVEVISEMHPVAARAWFDGACSGNPGPMGLGGIIKLGDMVHKISEAGGHGTNNIAEYGAIIAVMKKALELNVREIEIMGDSQLVVNQVNGLWSVKSGHLMDLCSTAQSLMQQFLSAQLTWIPRDQNHEADTMSSKAINMAKLDSTIDEIRMEKSKAVVLRKVAPAIYIAEGSTGRFYAVDTLARSCSCPDWLQRRQPCKHLYAAMDLDK